MFLTWRLKFKRHFYIFNSTALLQLSDSANESITRSLICLYSKCLGLIKDWVLFTVKRKINDCFILPQTEWMIFLFCSAGFPNDYIFHRCLHFFNKFKVSIGFLTTHAKVWTKYVPDVKEEFLTLEVYFLEDIFIVDKKRKLKRYHKTRAETLAEENLL